MAETAKKFKWSEGSERYASENYDPSNSKTSVAAIVEALSTADAAVSSRMVIGKLVHLGEYVAPEKKAAAPKDEGPTKKDIQSELRKAGFEDKGFEGATKDALKRLAVLVSRSDDFEDIPSKFLI